MLRRKGRQKAKGVLTALLFGLLLSDAAAPAFAHEDAAPPGGEIVISELMASNKATLDDGSGLFPDWFELHNTGKESVDLTGWTLSDREKKSKAVFPELSIGPDEYLLVWAAKDHSPEPGRLLAPFGLSEGETIYLRAPDGELKASAAAEADISMILDGDREYRACRYPTPGYPNTREGFAAFRTDSDTASPLVINEVLVKNERYLPSYYWGLSDIVELKNVSDTEINLADYAISDRKTERRCALPDQILAPGELFLLFCCGEERDTGGKQYYVPIALNALEDRLFLYGPDGMPVDYMTLRDIPDGGSFGRVMGERGRFYFASPTPGEENGEGKRFVSARPVVSVEPGVYEDPETVLTVELSILAEPAADASKTRIYYTLDGTLPDESSVLYTDPVVIKENTVLRAVAVEADALPGKTATYTYLIGERHSLPVLCLTADDLQQFKNLYFASAKSPQTANAALFDGEHSFNKDGMLSLKGHTSLKLPKKSLGMSFPDSVDGPLEADVFGNGVTDFAELSIRAGQDNLRTLFRTELMQDLVLESSEHLMAQSSKFCAVYINGQYWGIYALKEKMEEEFYAAHRHVSSESVAMVEGEAPLDSDFYRDVIGFVIENDMSEEENYATICRTIDVDSFIDWIIFEGYSGNTDTINNIVFFRSSEDDGLWRWGLLDLDWAFQNPEMDYRVIIANETNSGYQMYKLIKELMRNDEFKARFFRRFGELNRTTLSNAHVLEAIDHYAELLNPEIDRDEFLRGSSYQSWRFWVDELKSFITEYDRENHNVMQLAILLDMTEEEVRAAMEAERE